MHRLPARQKLGDGAQRHAQTLRGDRLLEKSKRLDGLSTAARMGVRVGGYEQARHAEAV
jgi:hypothetical protein